MENAIREKICGPKHVCCNLCMLDSMRVEMIAKNIIGQYESLLTLLSSSTSSQDKI